MSLPYHPLPARIAVVLTLLWVCHKAAGGQAPSPILPLADVKPGMKGEARTVFQGTTPETFPVRVVSVLRNFLPKQDIILIRAEDPRVDAMGIAAGMSGSPVYVDGKLMGAIAYGWSFAKEPLAGVTPIESMLAERNRPDRPPADPPSTQASVPGQATATGAALAELRPVAIPLSVSGASDASLAYLGEELGPLGLRPVRAGGTGGRPGAAAAEARLLPGAAVGAALMSGDMSTTAMGTLTYADGKQVFAFGHPMLGIGSVSVPLVQGEIHAIIPSLSSSLKMSSPVAEIGSITDDGKNGIIGVLGDRASTVRLVVDVTSAGIKKRAFQVAIARHRRLLPMLATMAASTALSEAIPDVTDMTAEVTTRLFVQGFPALVLKDVLFTNDTLAPRVLAMSHGMRALGDLLGNPFSPVVMEKIEIEARVAYRPDAAEIVAVAASADSVRAGSRVPLRVTLRPYHGSETVETLVVEIPRAMAGRVAKIEVAAGGQVKPEQPRAESLTDLVANLRTFYRASDLVVSLTTADEGVALHGRLIRNLPPAALDTLRPASQSRRADGFRVVQRTAFPRARVMSGQKEIQVLVREPATP